MKEEEKQHSQEHLPKESDKIEIHNREMSDILGAPPVWLVRTGSPVFYVIIFIFLVGTAFFSYPDTAYSRVTVGDQSNVEWVLSHSTGLVEQFFVQDQTEVAEQDTLGLIKNMSSYKDMETLRQSLVLLKKYVQTGRVHYLADFPTELIVGDMKESYELLLIAIENCLIYEKLDVYHKKKSLVDKELIALKKDEVINELAIIRTEQKLFDLSIEHEAQKKLNRKDIKIAYERLLNEIEIWKGKYIIQNKSKGTVIMGAPWAIGQKLNIGDTICSVVSQAMNHPVGRMILSYKQIPGLNKGNRVMINLDEYPVRSYGSLIGVVDAISYVPAKKNYAVEVTLPYPLVTTTGKNITYTVELHGMAEIITLNKSVLERILEPIIDFF